MGACVSTEDDDSDPYSVDSYRGFVLLSEQETEQLRAFGAEPTFERLGCQVEVGLLLQLTAPHTRSACSKLDAGETICDGEAYGQMWQQLLDAVCEDAEASDDMQGFCKVVSTLEADYKGALGLYLANKGCSAP